jgi:hypothetical protein
MNEDALRRVTADVRPDVVDALVAMAGSDLATLMLEVSRRRAEALDPVDVLHRYATDRFVTPAEGDGRALRAIEDLLLATLPDAFESIVLSPLVPFGTHAIAGVAQSRVVSTIRGTEVAADPTNGLALEAAVRRRELMRADPRSNTPVRLAASQRVVRAQTFQDAAAFSHFHLFGMVSAGRDTGNLGFEREAAVEHIEFVVDALHRASGAPVIVALTDLTGGDMTPVSDAVRAALADAPYASVRDDPGREGGRVYYDRLCFKAYVATDDEPFEIADGGFVDWTQRLVASRKERLMISGIGVERLAMLR